MSELEAVAESPIGLVGKAAARRKRRRIVERLVLALLFFCGAVSILTTLGIVAVLSVEGIKFFKDVTFGQFFFGTVWTPLFTPAHYGVLPLVAGTTLISLGAILVAAPLGLAAAIYLSEYAGERARTIIKPVLEILAGVPTVVYGYFALTLVTPVIRIFYPDASIFNALSASIVMGIMIIPLIFSLSDDAMRSVPQALRNASFGLGATRMTTSVRVVVPAALSGIIASFILAISRAVGETMIVVIAAGSTPKLTANPFESIQAMTAYIVQVSLGDTPTGTPEYYSIFAVGGLLFLMTLFMNLISQRVVRRYRQEY